MIMHEVLGAPPATHERSVSALTRFDVRFAPGGAICHGGRKAPGVESMPGVGSTFHVVVPQRVGAGEGRAAA